MSLTRTCCVENCETQHYCKGFCVKHYQRFRKYGDPLKVQTFDPAVCIIDGCDKAALTLDRTLCSTHYARWKHGSPLDTPIRPMRPARGICSVSGCENLDCGPHGYCPKHLGRVRNNGSPHVVKHQRDRDIPSGSRHPGWTGDDATYSAIHQRIRKMNGRASDHKCVDCARRAAQWSYTHTDPKERFSEGEGAYSTDPHYYVPRCVRCHKNFDMARIRALREMETQ